MKKGKVWYVKSGRYYDGDDINGIFATYEEAKKCYDNIIKKRDMDRVQLWRCDLGSQKYDSVEAWVFRWQKITKGEKENEGE